MTRPTPDLHPSLADNPIANIQWIPVDDLYANDWNPNHVLAPEMRLLKLSLLKQKWIQPVLVAKTEKGYRITDGFHRSTLCREDKDVRALTGGLVPCSVLEMSDAEAMLLTVRINRAKGSHNALRMHELVKAVVATGFTPEQVAAEIGATKHEIDTLLLENVFQDLKVAETPYSKAWQPK